MTKSSKNIPHFYLNNGVNLGNLVALRKQLQSSYEKVLLHLTFTDIFIYAVSRTLIKQLLLNASNISDGVGLAVSQMMV